MGKIEGDDEAGARIEAALYSAGRPLTMEELIRASGTESRSKTMALMANLIKRTKSVFKAIEVASLPDGSYVAYMEPISSKQLVEIRGSGVYIHLRHLYQLGYVEYQNVGRMKIYTTSEKFQKYFGVQGGKDALKQKLFSKVRSVPQIVQAIPEQPTSPPAYKNSRKIFTIQQSYKHKLIIV